MTPLQYFGTAENDGHTSHVMLCMDGDRSDEGTLHMWGGQHNPAALLLKFHWCTGGMSAGLEVLNVYRTDEFGSLFLPTLTAEEIETAKGLSGMLYAKADGSLEGGWNHPRGETGQITLRPPQSLDSVAAQKCANWSEFKAWAASARDDSDACLFRGHGSNRFRLATTLHRLKRTRLERYCSEMLHTFRMHAEAILRERIDTASRDDYSMLLGLAQHHGLPTPLLDWTSSPYVAAFFAYSDAVDAAESRSAETHIRVYGLTRRFIESHSRPVVSIPYFAPYVASLAVSPRNNPRLYAQQGQFLATNVADVEDFLKAIEKRLSYKILIAADVPIHCANEALEDLAFMGLTAATMYPGLDGVSKMIRHTMLFKRNPTPAPATPAAASSSTSDQLGDDSKRAEQSNGSDTLPPAPA